MTDFEKNMDAIELSPETMEEAAGGTANGRKLRVIRSATPRRGPGRNYEPLGPDIPVGTIIEHFRDEGDLDERGVRWYFILPDKSINGYPGFISSRCCENI